LNEKRTIRQSLFVVLSIILFLLCSCSSRQSRKKEPGATPAMNPKPRIEPSPTKTRKKKTPIVEESTFPIPSPENTMGILPVGTPILVATSTPMIAGTPSPQDTKGGESMELNLKSEAFTEGEMIPKKYTGDSMDFSPPLSWSQPPEGTKSITIICDDPDAPAGVWVHWVIFNIKPDTTSLPENVPKLLQVMGFVKQGKNSFGKIGYNGPSPPRGKHHRYFFKIYALDKELELPAASTKSEVEKAMEGHILARGQLMGKYKR